jgi:fatty-acyl-CoA synthase
MWIEPPGFGSLARGRITSVSDTQTVERVPFAQLLPKWTLFRALEASALSAGDKPAITTLDPANAFAVARTLTFSELISSIRSAANGIHEASQGSAPVVSITAPLVPEALIAMWAGSTVGVANPINPFLRADHVAAIMNAAKTTVLVTGTTADGPGVWNELADVRSRVPTLREIWRIGVADDSLSFSAQVGRRPGDRLMFDDTTDPDAIAALYHTGGTTSAPKLVRHTHRGHLLNAWCWGLYGGSATDEFVLNGMPHFHVGGAILLALKAMLYGQSMILPSPTGYRDPRVLAGLWDIVERHSVTAIVSTPTTAAALLAGTSRQALPRGLMYAAGGSALSVQIGREFEDKFGIPLHEVWGMTELHGGLLGNPCGLAPRLGSVGIAYPYHRVRCVPVESGSADQSLSAGQVGILAVTGPCVTPGYLDTTRSDSLFLRAADERTRWLNTGDLCSIDDEGYVWLRGRSKDLIIRGGHNIDPMVIEAALYSHPSVLHAAAVGAPDAGKGEMPVAYVQLRAGAGALEPDLLAHCRAQICERAAVPRNVQIIESMPLTAVGKIFKPALRMDALRRCVTAILSELGLEGTVSADVRERSGEMLVALSIDDTTGADTEARLRREFSRHVMAVEIIRTGPGGIRGSTGA